MDRQTCDLATPAEPRRVLSERVHRVCVLVPPDVVPLDLAIPLQVFGEWPDHVAASTRSGRAPYELTLAVAPGARREGLLTMCRTAGLAAMEEADTIVVPGTRTPPRSVDEQVLHALRAAHDRGARILAICTGAFIVAAAGLLDGRRATTHWAWAAELRRRHPAVHVMEEHLYLDEGGLVTSAGILAGMDACLHVLRCDQGQAVANSMARFLVSAPHRQGNQAQFIKTPAPNDDSDLGPLLTWLSENLAEAHTLDTVAHRAQLSVRTLSRRFKSTTGSSVLAWVTARRVEQARFLLETTALPVTEIAQACGFASNEALRTHFVSRTRTSPSAYRRAFGPADESLIAP